MVSIDPLQIINACLLTSAWSAASSDLYTSSRALCTSSLLKFRVRILTLCADGLAASGNAPKIFLRASGNGLPYVSVIFNSFFALLSYMGTKSGSGRVFGWFSNMTSIAGLMTWFGISVTYLRFYAGLKNQGIDRTTLPFYSRFQPFAAWYAMISCFIVCLVSTLSMNLGLC